MELKTWLDQERGRYAALAEFLGISAGRMSQIAVDGVPREAKVISSTLRARDVDACIERAVAGLKLPIAPDGKPHEVIYALQLTQAEHDDDSRGCSAASRTYLATRRALG